MRCVLVTDLLSHTVGSCSGCDDDALGDGAV